MRRSIVLSILLALVAGHATAGEVSVTPFVGGYTFDDAQRLRTRPEYGLRAGYGITERWVVEGVADWLTTRTVNGNARVNAWKFRGELLYRFFPNERLVPFAAAGGGATTMSGAGKDAAVVDYGGGFIYGMSDRLGVRGDVRHVILPERGRNNVEYTLGLALLFGEKAAGAWRQQASGQPVTGGGRDGTDDNRARQRSPAVKPGEPGYPEKEFPGPGTTDTGRQSGPPAAPPERLAQLPPTAEKEALHPSPPPPQQEYPGVKAPPDGKAGQEPPPAGAPSPPQRTEEPRDTDHDGVPDDEARCPGSPGVDRYGCPKDSDHDGVPDLCDRCPDTPPGVAVDENGCPPPKKICITLNVRFAFDSSVIDAAYHDDIARVAAFLKKYPTATAVIEGHTDSTGPDSYNHWLSFRRADSVMNYLVERLGVEQHRLSARGFGESRPVATNATPEGRQQNRRIEAVIDCGLEPPSPIPSR